MSFQDNAFQDNAFQIDVPGAVASGVGSFVTNAGAPQQTTIRELAGYAVIFATALIGFSSPRPVTAAPQQIDLTQQAVFSKAAPGTFVGPTVRPIISAAPQQIDLTQQATITPPAPGYHGTIIKPVMVAGPQVVDLTQQAVYQRSATTAQGVVGPASYQWGSHAANWYEANATRTLFPTAPTPPATATAVPPLVYGSPQADPTQLAAVFFRPAPGYQGTTVRPYQAAPQSVDLTQQAVYTRSSPGYQGTTVKPYQAAPQLADLTQQAVITPPAPGYQGVTVKPYQAAPQADPTQLPAVITAPLSAGAGKLGNSVYGAPQQIDLTQQPVYTVPMPAPIPPVSIIAQTFGSPQADPWQRQPLIFPTATQKQGTVGPAEYRFGSHAQALYEQNTTRQVFPAVPTPPATVAVVPALVSNSASPQFDPTQLQPLYLPAQIAGSGKLGTFVQGSPQADPRQLAASVFRTGIGAQGYLIMVADGAPQDDPTQIQGQVFKSAQATTVPAAQPLQTILAGPQADPTQRQAVITPPLSAGSGKLGAQVYAAPQQLDLTLQPTFSRSSPGYQGRTIAPIPPTPPQQIDLTLQAVVTPTAITQPITGPTVAPLPAVPPQPDLNVNPTQVWTPSTYSPSAPQVIQQGGHGYEWATDVTADGVYEANRRKTALILKIRRQKAEAERRATAAASEIERLETEQVNQTQFTSEAREVSDDYARLISEVTARVSKDQGKKKAKGEAQLQTLKAKAEVADQRLIKAKARAKAVAERRAAMLEEERLARREAMAAEQKLKDAEASIEEERRVAQEFMHWLMRLDDD